MRTLLFALTTSIIFLACDGYVAVPKPRAYPRVDYPEKTYSIFNEGYCDFQFEMPNYATVERDTTFFEGEAGSDCWFNLNIPDLNAKIHCSYYPINNRARYDELVADAFVMANKHNARASYIEEIPISRPEANVHGVVFEIEGPAASFYQFFVSDTTRHFFRGALYFQTESRPDSLAPVIDFVRQDMARIVETLEWKG